MAARAIIARGVIALRPAAGTAPRARHFVARPSHARRIDDFGDGIAADCRSAAPHLATHAAHPRPPGTARIARRHDGAVRAPALAHLLAIAGAPTRESGGIAAALAARYGVTRQADWPLAPLRLAALGVDPGAAFWLAADPVTLTVGAQRRPARRRRRGPRRAPTPTRWSRR